MKYKIMRNIYKLKDAEDFKGWSLQHDMTKEQRENVKKLVVAAKQKQQLINRGNTCTE